MTATNGWSGKPGVPLNPEKNGLHWVKSALTGEIYLLKWKAEKFYSCGQPQILPHWVDHPMWQVKEMIYLGPCLTPDEVQNLRDDLASAERERAHQHGRADRNAAEHAREQAKREALQKRVVELEGVLRKAKQHFVADEPLKAFVEICAALEGEKDAL